MFDMDKSLRINETSELVPRRQTMRERLVDRQKRLTEDIVNVTKALELLDKNPAFEELQEAITRAL